MSQIPIQICSGKFFKIKIRFNFKIDTTCLGLAEAENKVPFFMKTVGITPWLF